MNCERFTTFMAEHSEGVLTVTFDHPPDMDNQRNWNDPVMQFQEIN